MELITTENGKTRTFSASQINTVYNCPRKWAYEYIAKIKPPPSFAMKKGTFIHAVIETFNQKLSSLNGRDESRLEKDLRNDILEVARELWEEDYVDDFEDQMRENKRSIKQQFFNYVDTLLDRYRQLKRRLDDDDRAWELSSPTANEIPVLVTDEDGEWLFRGAIDAVYEKHPLWFDRTALIDYKTGKSPYSPDSPLQVNYRRQLNIYAWLYYQAFGVVPEVAGIHFLDEPPTNPKSFIFQEIDTGTVESVHLMLKRVREMATSDSVDDYERNTDYKWCEFTKNDGTKIKCDHWDYCLGDEDRPDPTDRGYDGPERDPIEVTMSDPLSDSLRLSEHEPNKISDFEC